MDQNRNKLKTAVTNLTHIPSGSIKGIPHFTFSVGAFSLSFSRKLHNHFSIFFYFHEAPTMAAFTTKFSLPSFLEQVKKLTDSQKDLIKRTGFGNLLLIPNQVIRRSHLIKLMEKWSCEKQAFIFPPGELKITLLDVSLILGLRVIGQPVVLKEDAPLTSLEQELGASALNRTISVKLLKATLESMGERDDEFFMQVFLLYCFGTLLFPRANGKVDSRYLHLLQDVDSLSSFAWGDVVLEDLHNSLSQRKSKKTSNIGGCIILLQIWCYEHIIIGRPNLLDQPSTFPRACRWDGNARNSSIPQLDINFEELEPTQILWKLEPTSEEMEIDIIKEIPQEWHLRTGPGTIEQPIEILGESAIRMVRVHREVVEEEEEPTRQEKSTIFVLSDDEESKVIGDLKKEILELKTIIEERKEEGAKKRVEDEDEVKELKKKVQVEKELRKRVEDEIGELRKRLEHEEELRKKVQAEKELRKRVEDEIGELRKRLECEDELKKNVQVEKELRKRVEEEIGELKKKVERKEELKKEVQVEKELRKRVEDEIGELRKRLECEDELKKNVQVEKELRKRVEDEIGELRKKVERGEELRKEVQVEKELRKRVEDENGELRKRVECKEEAWKRIEVENERLCNENRLMEKCITDLGELFATNNSVDL
ncbi:hypothetical protein QVD17_00347 [Tagetes erecta]|uniref:Aminotransferase-like plant mobile domain-containing protein n=1 Tax=Tagetes erecta TaxID=13708 RepID=A0AAD8P6X2_TARER|nr:hypothetical protein QVD17_00347 [Tagetes erecta]